MRSRFILLLLAAATAHCSTRDAELRRLHTAAQQHVWRGELAQALELIAEAEAAPTNAASEWPWAFRLLRAEVYLLRRDVTGARALLTATPPSESQSLPLDARRHYLLAQTQSAQGQFAEAITTLRGAREKAARASARAELLDIDILHGQMLLRMGKWSEADPILLEVVRRAVADHDPYRQAVALHNLSRGRALRNRFDEALAFLEPLLGLTELQTHTVYASALTHAGMSYARIGQFDNAISVQKRAVAIHEKAGVPLYLEQALGELGHTYVLQGDAQRGMTYLTRAYEVAKAAKLTADAALWAGNVAATALELGNIDQAERLNHESTRLKALTKGSTLYNTLNAALIALRRGNFVEARSRYREVLGTADAEPAAQWQAHAGLARVARSAGDSRAAARHYDDALRTIQRVRADLLKPEYRLTFLTRVIHFYRDYVETLAASGSTQRALEVADASRGVVLAERMGGSAGHLQTTRGKHLIAAAKRSGGVWLSYWLAPERSYVWVVTGDGIRCVSLPSSGEIEKLVERYRSIVEQSSSDPLASAGAAGDALYDAVIAPVSRFIPPGASVRIVPDGALHNVNFETLPVGGSRRHYWIEDVRVAIAPSLGILAANIGRSPGADARSLLLVGDPTPRLKEFPRLGYAPIEMSAVSRHFDGAQIVRHDGERATPAEFFAAGPERFSIIHFTAHAAANRTSPLDSAVILSGPGGADKLYARDVAERSLRADLVTISACKSAGERAYAGEGLIGFAWAFLRAGSREVIAGLWDVDDQSTAALMDALYAGIARGQRPVDALRNAKLAVMKRGGNVSRPYYWGPFELFTVAP